MTYTDIVATMALVFTVGGVIFAYTIVPPDKRAEGWNILGYVLTLLLTLACIWQLREFVTVEAQPTRGEFLYAIIFTIGGLVGWGFLIWVVSYALTKKPQS